MIGSHRTGLGIGAAGVTALVSLVAGCSSSSNSVKPAAAGGPSTAQSSASGGSSASLQSKSTSIGTVLVDANGHTVYELVGDSASNPNCTGACLTIWPEVKVNGTQVVVNGHPAFTFAEDSAAGDTKGQNVKDEWGVWLALDASGNPIPAASTGPSAPASSKAPNGGAAAF